MDADDEEETRQEEHANMLTHAFGVLLCLAGIPLLINRTLQVAPHLLEAICVFSFGLLSVYLSSTFYHMAVNKTIRRPLRLWDHLSIFFLIVGTHTPIVLKYVNHSTAIIFLSIMWAIIGFGILMKIFYTGKIKALSVALYLSLGWMSVFIIKPILTNMPLEIFWWLLAGGLAYTLGTIFYVWIKLKYHHAIWHCFVLAGTICHFVAIYLSLPVVVRF